MPRLAALRPFAVVPKGSLKTRSLLIFIASFLVATQLCNAQMTPPGADVARPIHGAGHDYIHALAETVNPANGSVNVKIDLPTPKGRGVSFPYSIIYNSGSVHHLVSGS